MSPAFGNSANRRPAAAASCLPALTCFPLLPAPPAPAANAKLDRPIRKIDFRNFSYPSECDNEPPFRLRNGLAPGGRGYGVVKLISVRFADLDRDGREEALVVLGLNCHTSCRYTERLYVFAYRRGSPRVIFQGEASHRYGLEEPADLARDVWKLRPSFGVRFVGNKLVITDSAWDGEEARCCHRHGETTVYGRREGRIRPLSRRRTLDPNGPGDPAASLLKQ